MALRLGLCTRWAAIALAIDVVGATLTVHLPHGFFLPQGFEYPLTLLVAHVALPLLGPGKASADRLLERQKA